MASGLDPDHADFTYKDYVLSLNRRKRFVIKFNAKLSHTPQHWIIRDMVETNNAIAAQLLLKELMKQGLYINRNDISALETIAVYNADGLAYDSDGIGSGSEVEDAESGYTEEGNHQRGNAFADLLLGRLRAIAGGTGYHDTDLVHLSGLVNKTGIALTSRSRGSGGSKYNTVCTASSSPQAALFIRMVAAAWQFRTGELTFAVDVPLDRIGEVVAMSVAHYKGPKIDIYPARLHHVEVIDYVLTLLIDGAVSEQPPLEEGKDFAEWFEDCQERLADPCFFIKPTKENPDASGEPRGAPSSSSPIEMLFFCYGHQRRDAPPYVSCYSCGDLLRLLHSTTAIWYDGEEAGE